MRISDWSSDVCSSDLNQFLQLASENPKLQAVRPNGKDDEPQFQVNVDDEKARALQVSIAAINETMSAAWGSMYVNDFIDRGREIGRASCRERVCQYV